MMFGGVNFSYNEVMSQKHKIKYTLRAFDARWQPVRRKTQPQPNFWALRLATGRGVLSVCLLAQRCVILLRLYSFRFKVLFGHEMQS